MFLWVERVARLNNDLGNISRAWGTQWTMQTTREAYVAKYIPHFPKPVLDDLITGKRSFQQPAHINGHLLEAGIRE